MSGRYALFAHTLKGEWLRLSEWLETPDADELYARVDRLYVDSLASGSPLTVAGIARRTPVRYFALRPCDELWAHYPQQLSVRAQRWSARTYRDDTAAGKAWNRATGSRYAGAAGGWISRAGSSAPVCQGWARLLGTRRTLRELTGARFLADEVAL